MMKTQKMLKLVEEVAKYAIAAGHEITLEISDRDSANKVMSGAISDSRTGEQRVTLTAAIANQNAEEFIFQDAPAPKEDE